ncbi:uncharacterized protein TRIVIDRAFT_225100 [Trichoderma virens Gv29-8]|uniref:PARP catalytic domain-containing protein n=1 Tax=Hypocrea virens (strain Gv29-8 / FGSC 10586) TaxID=413071 RepID=G9N2B8_HYPVG|nr:uncharacterized protein TRIVIDRAFT_225100 [Trichoderma virens Gv29-8]EHK19231.1 hypothetical protein TRIVIDRAFT_225100 [Trichoderma virens Gv29-8]UKZ49318.1 hypothetical protein TrVGV298_003564 [Trichoderma virens]
MALSINLIDNHLPPAVTTWSQDTAEDLNEQTFHFHFSNFTFQLCLSIDHQIFLSSRILDTNSSIPRRILDPLRQHVRSIFLNLYNEHDDSLRVREEHLHIAILQALEHISEYREEAQHQTDSKTTTTHTKGWSASEISSWEDIVSNPFGLDVSTIRDTASFLLGMTPEEIAQQIPSAWRIIHFENIMREDLLKRFRRYQEHLRAVLPEQPGLRKKLPPHSSLEGRYRTTLSIDTVVEDMVKPRLTFHGTSLRNVRSIIRNGFLLPGKVADGKRIESPRSGIAFNRGIYSSQSAAYAMSYASGQREQTPLGMLPSMRLFVCATVMGRTYAAKSDNKLGSVHGPLVSGYDSHFDGRYEYIIHEERAMLPCFVIHLDLGSEEALRSIRAAQLNPASIQVTPTTSRASRLHQEYDDSPGDRKRKQLALKAAAMKWFPYGFGTATGTSFVIEDIGATSDDSETYGDWQEDKHAYEQSEEQFGGRGYRSSEWDEEEGYLQQGLFLDEYQRDREIRVDRGKKVERRVDQ